MMKLKHGDNFARKAGSIWRLLFVFALFPWLRKYRILNDDNDTDDDGDETAVMMDDFNMDSDKDSATRLRYSVMQSKIGALNAKIKRLTEMNKHLAKNK